MKRDDLICAEVLGSGIYKLSVWGSGRQGEHAGCELILDRHELEELIYDLTRVKNARVTITVLP